MHVFECVCWENNEEEEWMNMRKESERVRNGKENKKKKERDW